MIRRLQHPFEIRQIARDDPQAVVIKAQNMLHRLHLGDRGDRALEILQADAALRGEFHAQKHRHAEAQRLEVELKPPPRRHPRLRQTFDPPPGGRLRQAHAPPRYRRP
jgi:hypothetical protein